MNGESAVGFKMKIRIHNEGVVEAMKNSYPPPAPPPAGDMGGHASGGHVGCNINKGLMVIIDSLT